MQIDNVSKLTEFSFIGQYYVINFRQFPQNLRDRPNADVALFS